MNKMRTTSDEELIVMLKNGVFSAFGELYDRYWGPMIAKAHGRLKNQEDAEEVVQELFVKIWRRRERIELQFTFKTYIFAALRYEILDFLAKQLNRKDHFSIDETTHFDFPAQDDSFYSMEMKELQQQVNEIIEDLPEKCQLIFKMSRNDGFSNREIADQLSLSHRTVETQISKAIKTLKQTLKRINILLFLLFILFLFE